MISPLHRAIEAPGLVMSPMGVAEQLGVISTGEFVPKKRLTHDLSFPGQYPGKPVKFKNPKIEVRAIHVRRDFIENYP